MDLPQQQGTVVDERNAESEFLAVLSHQFRTPLQAMFGYTELLEREIHGPLSAEQRRDLAGLRESQQHLLRLTDALLEFANSRDDTPRRSA